VLLSPEAGIEDDPDSHWMLVCHEHAGCCGFPTRTETEPLLSHPEEWCPTCQEKAALLRAGHRNPYIGSGSEGARPSAQIDREEADTYDAADRRRTHALASAEAWTAQAEELEVEEIVDELMAFAAAAGEQLRNEAGRSDQPQPNKPNIEHLLRQDLREALLKERRHKARRSHG
jgi:hypothetical protein